MPCPHCKITIIKRSENESAVSAAAYQSGEKLFSEYDQEQKYYPYKNEVTYKEILLPPHAPPEFADHNTLWNSAEAQEKQWNSQLARRFVLAIPREIPPEQYADLIRDYCREFFVSKGMIADFAIHDKGDGNPHAHILLTMRAMDEKGRWRPKSRKVYDLDKNGERIRLPSGRWKSHKENTVDWNDQKYAEIWRQEWADTANRYLEADNRPERLDLRSYIVTPAEVEEQRRQHEEQAAKKARSKELAKARYEKRKAEKREFTARKKAGLFTPEEQEAEEKRLAHNREWQKEWREKRKVSEPEKPPKQKSINELMELEKTGADLTPEESERLAAYRRKKADQQKARHERKKAGELKEKVS